MSMTVRVYLDTNIYNRQFDDQSQPRIWLETQAASVIMQMIENKKIEFITSSVVSYENSRNPYKSRRRWVERIQKQATHNQVVDEAIEQRAKSLEKAQVKALDALHLACAEATNCDYFVTCDDRLMRRYRSLTKQKITVCNPTEFVRVVRGA